MLFGLTYLAAIFVGHALSFPQLGFATFWPAAGLFLATLALCKRQMWWHYLCLATLINLSSEVFIFRQSVWMAVYFAIANGLEAGLGAFCLRAFTGGPFRFLKLRHVLEMAAIAVVVPTIGASLGAVFLQQTGLSNDLLGAFQMWWQADSVGILLVAPVQISFASVDWSKHGSSPRSLSGGQWIEVLVLVALLAGLSWLAFGPLVPSVAWGVIGLIYLAPCLTWAGLRLGRIGASSAAVFTLLICLYFTTRGHGLFALATPLPEFQAISFQSFSLVAMLTPLIFATVIEDLRVAEEQVRSNLSILQAVLDNTTDLIYVKNLDGTYALMNQAGATLLNRPVEDIVGRPDREIVPLELADNVRQRDQLVYAAGHALTFEESSDLNGQRYWFLTTKSPFRDSAGRIIGLVGLSRDVTQRIDQIQALAASERRYRTLVTSSTVGIYETDAHGHARYLNPRWSELTGRPATAGEDGGWLLCLHPDDREPVQRAFTAAIAQGTTFQHEYRYLLPDGRINWVIGTAVPMRDEQGIVTGYLGSVVDISEQKRALQELQASEERFRRLADSAPVLIWTSTTAAQFTYCNRCWLTFTGRSLREELGLGWLEYVHPEDRDHCLRTYQESEAKRLAFRLDYRLRRHDGEYRWMHHEGTPNLLASGGFSGFVGTSFDITDQRRATETLVRAKEELEHHVAERTAALRDTNQQLQAALVEQARTEEKLQQQQTQLAHVSRLSVMGEMAAGLAHELNQPLFAIQNYTAGILRRWPTQGDLAPELREIIAQIAQESTRAAVIIRRVREFARKQLGERVSLHLNEVIQEVLQLLASEIRKQKIQVRLQLAEHLPTVRIDRVQIQQVLVNLIRNALDSMEVVSSRHRLLTISTFLSPGEVHCQVEDSGAGISPEFRQRLFEPFFTTKQSGLGMGLSISRSIVEAHGGSLVSEVTPTGAAFHFNIPLLEEHADDHRHSNSDRILS
jgi:PAS domain S-box-containing protein